MKKKLSDRFNILLARAAFRIYPFSALPRAIRYFNTVTAGTVLTCPLFGFQYFCNVSREGPQRLLYLLGERSISESKLVQSLLKPGMRAFDIGANVGYYTLMIAEAVGTKGQIFAIEPSPENLPELSMNVDRNGLANVTILPVAVGAFEGQVAFRGGINGGVAHGQAAYTVMQKTLDVLAADSADFIKVDIEGYEYEALRGGRAVLESHPIMFVEVHPKELRNNGSSATEVLSLLSRHYSNIEIYEELKSARILTRILKAYGVVDRLHRVTDHSRYLKRCENGEIVQPFWAVAKPPH